jgi:hypothetical protein
VRAIWGPKPDRPAWPRVPSVESVSFRHNCEERRHYKHACRKDTLKRHELVYEPFLGSGTTLAAAELTERVCCGIELDPKYVDVIVQRWQTLSGKKAKLDGDGRTFEEVAEERKRAAV